MLSPELLNLRLSIVEYRRRGDEEFYECEGFRSRVLMKVYSGVF